MVTLARKMATYQDVLDAPPDRVAQLVNGELFVHPRPASRHAHAASTLGMDIGSPFQRGRGGPGGWWIVYEPELHLGSDVLVPDLGGWRRDRMDVPPDAPYFELSPDWVCEVLSPSTATLDRVRKLPLYAQHGVGHVWLLDPGRRSLEVFRNQAGHWLLVGLFEGDAQVAAEPFAEVTLELSAFWLPEPGTGTASRLARSGDE